MSQHPDYPVVQGDYQLTHEWALSLPDRFHPRIEDDGDLVIWRAGLTF